MNTKYLICLRINNYSFQGGFIFFSYYSSDISQDNASNYANIKFQWIKYF